MSLEQLVHELHGLSRADKLRIVQLLVNDLAADDTTVLTNAQYEVWSPSDSGEAARILLQMLEEDQGARE
ncbi:MAG: hypothetical protein IPK17_39185 [Chloroflexi bacterium]|uniref:hypothetical protein n=1 Tax=Candidatus Flexifilum breve TaxID=3140694 RepID=UPI0031373541|nr:hypothetical protein [Chloroflexota bacterium]